ncbi:MAG TPA: hypothetical protein VMY37_04450 [Thermoguttaceae bacterium]|nr:hypothetical protein [Thermoguttaceae bacterium]
MSAEFLAGFKEGRAALRKNLLAAFAKEGRALRAAAAAEISGPYRRRRKYLQKLLDVLAGEQPAADRQPAEPAAVESAEPEPEPAEKTGKGRRKKR